MEKLTFNNTNMYLIPSEKFKTFSVALKFFVPLKEETASLNGVFPFVLKSGSKNFPDMIAISKALESYYGGVVDVNVRKKGDLQEIDFYFEFLSPSFSDEAQIDNCISFIKEVILNPKKEGNGFSKTYTELEKANLIDYIDGIINDKKEYTAVRLIEEMFKGEPYGLFESGTKENVLKITPENLFSQYERVIGNAHLEIFISGNADLYKIAEGLKIFTENSREAIYETKLYDKDNKAPDVTEEKAETVQGKFGLGFKTGVKADSEDYFKLTLLNSVFGSGPTSKLFMNVREKMSLCYYVYSRLDRLKGIMTVFTGCDREKFKVAYDEILNQLKECQNGNIKDEEIKNAKSFLTTVLKQTSDSQRSLNEFYMTGILSGHRITPDEYIKKINATTKEDIVRLSRNIKLQTEFYLK